MIYFDNAATTGKKPVAVVKAVEKALYHYSANPGRSGHTASIKAAEKVFETRKKVADFFGTKQYENVIFTLNCTMAINLVLHGVLQRGDHIIISNLEHNAVARPVFELSKKGVQYDVFDAFSDDLCNEIRALIKPNTKMIFCTHASNVCGKIIPIEEIGELCFEKGILFGVDAAQTAGILPIETEKMHIDFLCIAPHKGLYAPMGCGVLIAMKPIKPIIQGGTGTSSLNLEQPIDFPEALESGTINLPGVLGINAGVDFVKKHGLKNIYTHEANLCKRFLSLCKMNKNIVTYAKNEFFGNYAPVVSFNLKDVNSNRIAEILSNKGFALRAGLHCAPLAHKSLGTKISGTVRFAPSIYNNKGEVDALIYAVNKINI